MSFREFSIKRGIKEKVYKEYKDNYEQYLKDGYKKGATWIYMEDFEKQYPLIAKTFFDLRYGQKIDNNCIDISCVKSKVNKKKYKIRTEKISCRVESDKWNFLKNIYGNCSDTELLDKLIDEKVSDTFGINFNNRLLERAK